jgi:cytochrome c
LVASAGPSYRDVALKYQGDKEAALRLTKKIASGGAGVWGQVPMPPHPQHTEAEIRGMVQWILSLSATDALPVSRGVSGSFLAPQKPGEASRTGEGILVVKALYTDDGKGGTLPRLQGEKTIVLHSRRKKAALCDENFGAALVEQVEGEIGLIGRFPNGAHIIFKDINLRGITRAVVRAGNFKQGPAVLELRKDGPRGPLLASLSLASTGEGKFEDTSAAIDSSELLNLCVVARCADGGEAGLNWIEFQ